LTHLAARNGHLKILQFLQQHNALSLQKENRFQTTGLDLAVAMKHTDCVDFLIEFGSQHALNSALLNASQEGNLLLVKQLVLKGASLECCMMDNGATPLDRACYNGHLPVVEFLLERGS